MKANASAKRKIRLYSIVFLIAAMLFAGSYRFTARQPAFAWSPVLSTYTVKVEKGYLALRRKPSGEDSNIMAELYTGETVVACPIPSEKDGYRFVYSPKVHKVGYVNGNYLVYKGTYDENNLMYAKVSKNYLALRSGKETKVENETGKLYTGDPVVVLDRSDSTFWMVYAPELSKAGYVNRNYLVSAGVSTSSSGVEPDFPMAFPPGSYCDYKWDSDATDLLNFRMEVTNYSNSKTITAFEVVYYGTDVWGEWLNGEDHFYAITTEKTVRPGETVTTDYMPINGRSRLDRIYAVIRKVRYSDGTVEQDYSIDENSFEYWDIDIEH